MPNNIYRTGLKGKNFVSPTSRYHGTEIIRYGPDGRLTYPIYKKRKLHFSSLDKHFEITKNYEYRPDKVSYEFFGAPDFWWKIMEMNGMKDILEFKAGRNIILPGSALLL